MKNFLSLLLLVPLLCFGQAPQELQGKTVNVVVGFAPGGPTDVGVRRYLEVIKQQTGVNYIVVNRPGNQTSIASRMVADAKPDGTTILATETSRIFGDLMSVTGFPARNELVPVANMWGNYLAIYGPASLPFNTLTEGLEVIRKDARAYNYASPTAISGVIFENLFRQHGISGVVGVPFKGVPDAEVALLSGSVQLAARDVESVIALSKSGRVKILAVVANQRLTELPDVPAITEIAAGLTAPQIFTIYVPAGTSMEVQQYYNRTFNNAGRDAELRKHYSHSGKFVLQQDLPQTQSLIKSLYDQFQAFLKRAGII